VCVCVCVSTFLLEAGVSGIISMEDLLRVQLPVLQGTFDQAGDHHEQQHQDVDTRKHLVHHRRLFDPKCQQTFEDVERKKDKLKRASNSCWSSLFFVTRES